jgi:hypothetical protein
VTVQLETEIDKYESQNVRGPFIKMTYMTLDSFQQLHVELSAKGNIHPSGML